MHANTLAKLGLPPTASPEQITTALQSPAPGQPAEAWTTEVSEYMESTGVNWQTAWENCQNREPALYAAYGSDCETRNKRAVAGQSANALAVARGKTTSNAGQDLAAWFRSANSDAGMGARFETAFQAFLTALQPGPMGAIPEAALRHFMKQCLAKLQAAN